MDFLIIPGALTALGGLVWLVWCIVLAARLRKAGLDRAAFQARMQRLVAHNMGALGLSALGLMMVVIGMLL
ncbi:MAG: hypothetical protein ACE5DK_11415 [Paracoccaceae bacterium]